MFNYRDLITGNYYDMIYQSLGTSKNSIVETKVTYTYYKIDNELIEITQSKVKQHIRDERLGKLLDEDDS